MELEDLLEELRSAGQRDSTGTFSIDLRHGLQKLRRYQLLDKNRYGLLLMAAAHARGAPRVEIRNDSDDFILSWPGPPLTRSELEDLFRLNGPLMPLGLALLNAQALQPRFLRVDTGGLRLEIRGGTTRVVPGPALEGVRVHVRERYGWRTLLRLATEWLQLPPESALIERHCAGLGWPILINGRQLARQTDVGSCWLMLKLVGSAGREAVEAYQALPHVPVVERSHEGDFSAVAVVGNHLQRRGLTVVSRGVRFPQPDGLCPDLFLALLLVRPGQRLDLSFARVQADDELAQALAVLQQTVDEVLRQELAEAPPELLPGMADRMARRGQGDIWLEVQARRLESSQGAARIPLLKDLAQSLPRTTDNRAWQEALRHGLDRVVWQRRLNLLSVSNLRSLALELDLLGRLGPRPALRHELCIEHAFLLVGLGSVPEAYQQLESLGDYRCGLLCLLLYRDPRFLPATPLAEGLAALLDDRLEQARDLLEQAPRSLLTLDLLARLEALLGNWEAAVGHNALALQQSRGLSARLRQDFARALQARQIQHPLPPPGDLTQQLEVDREERGLALWSRGDAAAMAYLQQSLGLGWENLQRYATSRLGAAHPYLRVAGWTLGDQRLAADQRPDGFEAILTVELTALWWAEGFQV